MKKKLAEFGPMPTYMGCVTAKQEDDVFHEMSWGINSDGLLSVLSPPSLDQVYPDQHSEPDVSGLWVDHHRAFAEFLRDVLSGASVLEVGGGSGLLAKFALESGHHLVDWTILEPRLPDKLLTGAQWVEGWFPKDLPKKNGSLLVATHVLEHSLNPREFILDCSNYLALDGMLVISWPNMKMMAHRGDLNMLNFEHLHYLPVETVELLLQEAGFRTIEIHDFRGHSIFVKAQKVKEPNADKAGIGIDEHEAEALVSRYLSKLDNLVETMNEAMVTWPGPIWLFGAHIFSQYLFNRGLKLGSVNGLLDNGTHKQGLRLYGTPLTVSSPNVLQNTEGNLILLAAALYEEEILAQLAGLGLRNSRVLSSSRGVVDL